MKQPAGGGRHFAAVEIGVRVQAVSACSASSTVRQYCPADLRSTDVQQAIVSHRELAMSKTRISVAPQSDNSSITVAILFFSTMLLTASQSALSNAVMVGARLPGVILVAVGMRWRGMLY